MAGETTEAAKLARRLRRHGYTVVVSPGGHYHVRDAAGRLLVSFSVTPSHGGWRRRALADLRRAGVAV